MGGKWEWNVPFATIGDEHLADLILLVLSVFFGGKVDEQGMQSFISVYKIKKF